MARTVPEQRVTRRELWASRLRFFLLGVAIICIIGIGYLILTRGVQPAEVTVATLTPTFTPTETMTPSPTVTPLPPTATFTPGPSPTPLPPYRHVVQSGETWLGLSIYYDVSLDSLLQLNDRYDSEYIVQGEEVLIPYPTYTPTPAVTELPTLEVLDLVDEEQCRDHVVKAGETLYAIAINYGVGPQLLQTVNNISNPDLVKEGQTLCIPLVTPGPAPSPTFGPSPTPADRPLHAAPELLSPPAGSEVVATDSQFVTLQWTVAGFLAEDEFYMIEVRPIDRPEARAIRGYVKTTTWRVPDAVRPAVGKSETYSWRISVVRGTGVPGEVDFRWERTGLPSNWQTFMWLGVASEATPTPRQ